MSRIKDIKLIPTRYRYLKPFHIANSITSEVENIEIEVLTEDGFVGLGEASPSFRVNGETSKSVLSFISKIEEIKGIDVRNWRRIFDITDNLISAPSLKAGLQFAVIDAMCREIGIGVWEFFGGATNTIETDKTVSIGGLKERIEDAIKIKKEGFRIVKIKVGENLYEDIEAVYEIHKKVKMRYIIDANMGYTSKQAVYFAKKIYSYGIDIELFEQPVNMHDIEGLRYVRFNSPFPVCADESARTKYDVMRLIKEDAVDFVNIKLMKCGISDALAIVDICKVAGKGLMIGCMSESSIGVNQSVQFACGTGAFDYCDLDSHLMMNEKNYRGNFVQRKNIMVVN